MKYASQRDGTDLDPNQTNMLFTSQKSRPKLEEQKPISLGAVLDTVCTRCGGKGHLKAECYIDLAGDKKYEFVRSPSPDPNALQPDDLQLIKEIQKNKKRKKDKKDKKEKKHKKDKKHKHHH